MEATKKSKRGAKMFMAIAAAGLTGALCLGSTTTAYAAGEQVGLDSYGYKAAQIAVRDRMATVTAEDADGDTDSSSNAYAEGVGYSYKAGAEIDRLYGFDVGVDDYVVKPFSPREPMARVNVIVNRHGGALDSGRIRVGGIEMDVPGHNVYVDGERVDLTPKEYDVLTYLAEHKGVVLTRAQILSAVWGYEYVGDDRTVDWQVKLLRGKLGACRDHVVTVRGTGYKLEEPS